MNIVTKNMAKTNIMNGITKNMAKTNIMNGITKNMAKTNIMNVVTKNMAKTNIMNVVTKNVGKTNIITSFMFLRIKSYILTINNQKAIQLNCFIEKFISKNSKITLEKFISKNSKITLDPALRPLLDGKGTQIIAIILLIGYISFENIPKLKDKLKEIIIRKKETELRLPGVSDTELVNISTQQLRNGGEVDWGELGRRGLIEAFLAQLSPKEREAAEKQLKDFLKKQKVGNFVSNLIRFILLIFLVLILVKAINRFLYKLLLFLHVKNLFRIKNAINKHHRAFLMRMINLNNLLGGKILKFLKPIEHTINPLLLNSLLKNHPTLTRMLIERLMVERAFFASRGIAQLPSVGQVVEHIIRNTGKSPSYLKDILLEMLKEERDIFEKELLPKLMPFAPVPITPVRVDIDMILELVPYLAFIKNLPSIFYKEETHHLVDFLEILRNKLGSISNKRSLDKLLPVAQIAKIIEELFGN